MSDPLKVSDGSPNQAPMSPDQWLGGEAFLGSYGQSTNGRRIRRVWSEGEVLVACLGALTLGAAIGLVCARSTR